MCEYCGCQDVTAIAELTREHDAVVNLLAEAHSAVAAGDIAAAAGTARAIATVLGPHTRVEERGLFPMLAVDFPDEVAVLEAEHRRIEAVLGEAAEGMPVDPAWPARFMAAARELRVHILKEQDGVFPAALVALSGDAWDAVDAVREQAGSGLTAALADELR